MASQGVSRRLGTRMGLLVTVVAVVPLLTGCDGDDPVRSPLAVEDLGPGEWVGPLAEMDGLPAPLEADRCSTLGAYFPLGRDASLDEQKAFFGTDSVTVTVGAEQIEPGDIDPTEWEDPGLLLDRCVVAEADGPAGETTSASWRQAADGAILYTEHVTRRGGHTIQVAMTVTDEWFVYVHLSAADGAQAPDALELLERAAANIEAPPADV